MYELLHEITGLAPCIQFRYLRPHLLILDVDPSCLDALIEKYQTLHKSWEIVHLTDLGRRTINWKGDALDKLNYMGREIVSICKRVQQAHPNFKCGIFINTYTVNASQLCLPTVTINLPTRLDNDTEMLYPQDPAFMQFWHRELCYWHVAAELHG